MDQDQAKPYTLTCGNCQEQVEPVRGGFTPHFDDAAKAFTCTKDPRVIDPLSGELSAEYAPIQVPTQSKSDTSGTVTVSDSTLAATVSPN